MPEIQINNRGYQVPQPVFDELGRLQKHIDDLKAITTLQLEDFQQQLDEDCDFPPISNANASYRAYTKFLAENGESLGSEESMKLAIKFLSDICDYYLNRYDGDLISIKSSNTFQR
ncbi:hypothetical protein [Spirosoma sp.]|uniref:hypothetical protein n=1 Tax=Spirosoma sp. TaxID=1899569 RepID=UPI00262FEB25|nr:hypothetical protein [Spirosoma sp.]MCX6217587.1 hypothetical protein [Spirosoma sp.]